VTYQSYDLSRYFDGDPAESTLITVAGVDTVNCAHLLAAGFNTMSRSLMGNCVLAVVNTKAGTVQYDGKIEKFDRTDAPTMPSLFKSEPLADAGILYRDARIADARVELIEYVKRERAIWLAADKKAPVNHEHMSAWFRGVLDVLAKFLVVTGEADASEGHAVARRLCGISDE
jgi:hypothetical protein